MSDSPGRHHPFENIESSRVPKRDCDLLSFDRTELTRNPCGHGHFDMQAYIAPKPVACRKERPDERETKARRQ